MVNDILNRDIRLELKPRYLKLIGNLGYNVMYDLDQEVKDPLYDLQLLVTKIDKSKDMYTRKMYVTFMVPFSSILGFKKFKSMYVDGDKDQQAKFSQGVKNRMIEYSLDDVIAVLLSEGLHLQDIYQFKQGKGRLYLDRKIIRLLCESLNTKGSPLENPYINKKQIAERTK